MRPDLGQPGVASRRRRSTLCDCADLSLDTAPVSSTFKVSLHHATPLFLADPGASMHRKRLHRFAEVCFLHTLSLLACLRRFKPYSSLKLPMRFYHYSSGRVWKRLRKGNFRCGWSERMQESATVPRAEMQLNWLHLSASCGMIQV